MFDLIGSFFDFIANIIEDLGYWGIGIGMLLESACMPVPSEIVLPIGGKMVADGHLNMIGANIAVNVGSMIGSCLAYLVGIKGGRPFILRYGKYFFVSKHHFEKAERAFNRYGTAAVFFGRLLPVIRTFISLPAGIARMEFKKFFFYSLVGMIPWNFLLIYLGYVFGPRFDKVVGPYYHILQYGVVVVVFGIVAFLVIRYALRKRKSI